MTSRRPGDDDGRRPPADSPTGVEGDDSFRPTLPTAGTGARARLRAVRDANRSGEDPFEPAEPTQPAQVDDPAEPTRPATTPARLRRSDPAPRPRVRANPSEADPSPDQRARQEAADADADAAASAAVSTIAAPDLTEPAPPAKAAPEVPAAQVDASAAADQVSGADVRRAVVLEPEVGAAHPMPVLSPPIAPPAAALAEPAEATPGVDPEVLEIRRLFDVFGEEASSTPAPADVPIPVGPSQQESLFDGGSAGPAVAAASVLAPPAPSTDATPVGGDAPPADDGQGDDEATKRRWRRGRKVVSPPPRPPGWRRVVFAAAVLVLIAGGGALAYLGSETVRGSTDGRVISVTDDPDAPGFEAFVTPSPTMLVIHNNGDEVLGYTLLVLGPNDQGGAVVFIPTETLGELQEFGEQPLSLAYQGGGAPVATQVIQDLLGTGIQDVVEVDSPRWTTLTEPLAPFAFDNPDAVILTDPATGEDGLLFPAGEIQLEAVGVGQYLSEGNEGESDLARLARDEVFWTEWLAAIAASGDPGSVPGEVDSGIGRFARGLASGPVVMMTLPVTEFQVPDGPVVFIPNEAQIEALVTEIIPLPTSPEFGVRPKVRLLNGTTDRNVLPPLVTPLVQAGAEITVFGNASTFSEATTQIIFTDPSFSDDARALQEALGAGEIIREERPVENVDITIVIGTDYTGAN